VNAAIKNPLTTETTIEGVTELTVDEAANLLAQARNVTTKDMSCLRVSEVIQANGDRVILIQGVGDSVVKIS
jgi:hypothetical protein